MLDIAQRGSRMQVVHLGTGLIVLELPPGTRVARLSLFGAIQAIGLRSLPLVQVHLNDVVSIDGYAALEYDFAARAFNETYLLGASFVW